MPMLRKISIAILAAVLTHLLVWVGFAIMPENPAPENMEQNVVATEFMTVPKQAQLLVTPARVIEPPVAEPAPPEPPLPTPDPPLPAPKPEPTPIAQEKPQPAPPIPPIQEKPANDRARTLRLQAADKALAEARRRDVGTRSSASAKPPPSPPRPTRPVTQSKPKPRTPQVQPKGETRGPLTLRQTKPVYPRSLERKGVGGTVTVLISINTKGRSTSTKVQRSSGNAQLDRAAIAAVKRWRFKPALKNGLPVTSNTAVKIVFQPNR